ncbi:MAG TPA: hypothetical protein VKD45_06195, partial [Hyphomicrobiaceae bacterium]|nr:hypothetical protein [Hyphomicrobiaceae bacterium]
MSYKTILTHCNDMKRLSRLVGVAAPLAAAFGARLVGVSVIPPVAVIPAGMPGAADVIVIDEHAKAYRTENPVMRRAFEQAARA